MKTNKLAQIVAATFLLVGCTGTRYTQEHTENTRIYETPNSVYKISRSSGIVILRVFDYAGSLKVCMTDENNDGKPDYLQIKEHSSRVQTLKPNARDAAQDLWDKIIKHANSK